MPAVTRQIDERQRLAVLRQYAVLDTADEPAFDELTRLAARCCDTPIAAIGFVDEDRTYFKARVGLAITQAPREGSLCAQTILHADLFDVADAASDPRVDCRGLSLIGGPPVRAYAGVPLLAPTGEALGALCVMDHVPRTLTPVQREDLRVLGRQVMAQLELRRRTSEMAAQAQLLRTIFESEPQCVKVLDPDGAVRLMNRAGLAMVEASSLDEVAGRSILTFVAEEDREAYRAMLERVHRGEPGSLEFKVAGLEGGRRWLETHAVPLRDERQVVSALLGITRDITDQKRALEALRESEQKFRTLFEQATDGIFLSADDGRILDVNPAACQITGYTHAELTAMSVADLLVPDELPRVSPEIRRLSTGQTSVTEWNVRRKDGTLRTFEAAARQLPHGVQAFVRDVTDRKLADTALRDSESKLRQAVHAGRVGLWDWNVATNTVYYSPEWKRQIGYADDELSDELAEWRTRVHPDDMAVLEQQFAWLLGSDSPDFEVEFRFRHRDGSYRQILSHGSKVLDDSGRVVRVLGSHVDVTERNDLHTQLLQAQKMESIGRLAGGIAHDFNNLLTVINGMADLALMRVAPHAPLHMELSEIRLAGERAARLTRQLLALSRQQLLKPEVVDLSAIVANMQGMLPRLIGEDVRLVLAGSSVGKVKADPSQIEQVLLNLVVNARDAMPDGGTLTIETRDVDLDAAFVATHPDTVTGPHVLLAVADTGLGMSEATLKRAFEPFFTTKEPGKGTGLGLSTVYGIVKQSGGTVDVASVPAAGTTVSVYLPRVDQPTERATGSPDVMVTPGTETILVVEDERALRDFARRVLESSGYTVLDAGSGEEALTLMARHPTAVDLIVTDVVMPGMNGRELAARAAGDRPGIRILYMSGYTDDAILRHGVLDDAARFLMKPFTPAQLTRKVREVLDA